MVIYGDYDWLYVKEKFGGYTGLGFKENRFSVPRLFTLVWSCAIGDNRKDPRRSLSAPQRGESTHHYCVEALTVTHSSNDSGGTKRRRLTTADDLESTSIPNERYAIYSRSVPEVVDVRRHVPRASSGEREHREGEEEQD